MLEINSVKGVELIVGVHTLCNITTCDDLVDLNMPWHSQRADVAILNVFVVLRSCIHTHIYK